jgi:hypothetical protein
LKRSIIRPNCRRWTCEICGGRMRDIWAKHLIEVTEGQNLYLFKGSKYDFSRPLGAIIEQNADYAVFNCDKDLIIIANRPILDAKPIPKDKHEAVIREVIGKTWNWETGFRAYISPIHASKNWNLPKEKLEEHIEVEEVLNE